MRRRKFVEMGRNGVRAAVYPLLFGSLLFLSPTPAAHAKDRNECSESSLKGSYGYWFTGPLVGAGLVAAAGLIAFDGEGGLAAQDTVNNENVAILRRTGTGTYTVDSNCFGSVQLGGDFRKLSFDFLIVPGSGGTELSFIVTNPGTVQTGVAMATGDEECTLATFEGTYRNLRDRGTSSGNPAAGVELAILDGMGNMFFPEATQSFNGVISRVTATGTYRVSSNCTAALTVIVVQNGVPLAPGHREGVVVAGGNEAFLVGVDTPTRVGVARFKKQSPHGENESRHHHDD
jgi:hypothetical protein